MAYRKVYFRIQAYAYGYGYGCNSDWSNEEIVDFQLSVEKLCMTMERFREAAESVFHHPVTAETLDDCRMELLQERRIMLAVSACKAHKDEPVIMPQEDAGQAESPQSFGPVLG